MRACSRPLLLLVLALLSLATGGEILRLAGGGARSARALAEDAPGAPQEPFLGLGPLDASAAWDRNPIHLERLSGMGRCLLRTAPLAWGDVEPIPPRGGDPRYDWKALDEAVLTWQLAEFDPVLVVTPESPWAGAPRKASAWLRALRQKLPAEAAAAAERSATGAPALRDDTWPAWERFLRDLVERYDGDGRKDMPGLRRAVRHIQVLDRAADPAYWIGSPEEYLRLLHHAGLGARTASKTCRVLATSVDLRGTGYEPHPDDREWTWRIDQLVPKDAPLARLLVERQFALLRRLLESPAYYDVLPQRGADSLVDDEANIGFLRRSLDAGEGKQVDVWLVESPTRKLGVARAPGEVAPRKEEQRLRRRWMPGARNPRHPDHAAANAWMRRGQAFDLVRTLARARVAGAAAVLFLAPDDELPASWPRRAERVGQGFLSIVDGEGEVASRLQRTPSWYALRQARRHLVGHRVAEQVQLGAPGVSVVFRFPSGYARPWVAVLLLDPRSSWAGEPGAPLPQRDVLVALPNGRYVLEGFQGDATEPERKTVRVTDGSLLVQLGPAPLYVLPQP